MIKKISQKSRISSKPNLILTGGTGSIGKKFLEKIINNYNVFALGRKRENFKPSILEHKNFHFIPFDFSDLGELPEIKKIDIIVHLGGLVAGKNAQKKEYDKFNLIPTEYLLNLAIRKSVKKFIFASSVSIYGNQNGSVTEKSELFGKSDYAISKIKAEQILLKNSKVPVTIFRIASVYGAGNKSFINKLINLIKKRLAPFPNHGNVIKNYIYIDDLIQYFILELKTKHRKNEIYNIVNPENVRYAELVKLIKQNLNIDFIIKIPIGSIAQKMVSVFNHLIYRLNITKIENFIDLNPLLYSNEYSSSKAIKEFKYTPKVDIRKGIEKIIK